ncbi:MAG: aldo/keto reductase, partial [Alphaproteobacteria bacterium]|nr:aldo/keto reductase [Alphaproteobacteria bacterium]
MEYRQLGRSGLQVPVLSLGTGTFGGVGDMFKKWGTTDVREATQLIDISLDAGMNLFDTANIYSAGASEEILGAALKGRRDRALISTKATFPMGEGANDMGSSRFHLTRALEDSLKRLGTDYVDIYFMHGFDALTPVEETLATLNGFVESGKVRYIGASNFSGWHLMKSLAASERRGLARYVVYQGYYSLVGRDYEWDLMPLMLDQGVGTMVWSPLG